MLREIKDELIQHNKFEKEYVEVIEVLKPTLTDIGFNMFFDTITEFDYDCLKDFIDSISNLLNLSIYADEDVINEQTFNKIISYNYEYIRYVIPILNYYYHQLPFYLISDDRKNFLKKIILELIKKLDSIKI